MSVKFGVLAIQGDVRENVDSLRLALEEVGIDGTVHEVWSPEDISTLDGLVIPGGESTTIGQLSLANDSLKEIKEKIQAGMPVLGICAGMILLSNNASDRIVSMKQPLLEVLDVTVKRNAFGRQGRSFEADISLDGIGVSKFNGIFIRAPSITNTGSDVEVLSKFDDMPVAVKKGNIIGTSFHPELAGDLALHKYFVSLCKN